MKIIYIASSIIPSRWSNSFHVMKMCQAFRQWRHDIELVVPSLPHLQAGKEAIDIWKHYGIRERFPIRWMKWSRSVIGLDFAVRASWYARRKKPDFVFTRNIQVAALNSVMGLRTILEYHLPVETPFRRLALEQLFRRRGYKKLILTFFDHISFQLMLRGRGFRKLVVISRSLRGKFLRYARRKLGDDHILVCPDAIDLERFENFADPVRARRELGLDEARLTLGFAGHLYQGFGIELILDIAKRFPEYSFLILGGEDKDVRAYADQVRQSGLSNVRFFGFVPNCILPDYLAACDVLLMPYQRVVTCDGVGDSSQTMSPMKMFEYMATGRLIISSDLPVLREVLNENNSVLCEPDDIDYWQRTVERAAQEPEWRKKLGAQARIDVAQYTWRRRIARIMGEGNQI